MEEPTKETYTRWTNDPKNWIWGIFYYNPKDKRLMPPKKQEWMGWTVNFANKKSILLFAAILALVIIPFLLIEFRA